jgi:NADPH:quinone reductase-like Zn-dependent oxidoreductase
MRTWVITRHGPLGELREILRRVERHSPQPGQDEALVRVEAVGLNHMELWGLQGVPGFQFPLPLVPGCDVTGTLEAFGPLGDEARRRCDDAQLRPGSGVVVYPVTSCGECAACRADFAPLCPKFQLLGETRDGGCSDLMAVPVRNLVARPKALPPVTAAALPIAYVTAWSMIHRKAQLAGGQTILIHAGGSGVSMAAIQIAKRAGATVITTVGSDEKAERARRIGADCAINYRARPFREALKEYLKPLGRRDVDVVIDHVGADTFIDSIKSLAWGGKLVTCGATSGARVTLDLKPVFYKNLSILGSTMGGRGDLETILALVTAGELAPVIDSIHPMDELPRAIERLASREAFGKIVVTADGSAAAEVGQP